MCMYVVNPNQDGLTKQVRTQMIMPILMPILMPQMKDQVVIKANLGKDESLRDEDTTADKDGESKRKETSGVSEHMAMPKAKLA